MIKKLRIILSLVLCAALLCACGSGGALSDNFTRLGSVAQRLQEAQSGDEMPRFSQMVYERPSLEDFEVCTAAVEEALEKGVSFKKLCELLDECYTVYYHFDTMYCLADIRSSIDLTDSYYAEEYAWCDENFYQLQQGFENLFKVCALSEHGPQLERDYFWPGFCEEYGEESPSYYYEEALELMRRESEILSRYRSATAAPTVEVDGVVYDYNEYILELEGEEYDRVNTLYYRQHNEELAQIYIDLVRVRTELAAELGFESYEQMQYVYTFERDYIPQQAADYFALVKEHIVPVYLDALKSEAVTGLYYDYVGEDELLSTLESAVSLMGDDISGAFNFMKTYELYDISQSSRKLDMSYQTYLTDYEAPFLFMSPYGDTEDILTFAHEFGHYADALINYNAYETIDLSECYSQAMEYLVLFYLREAVSEEDLANLWNMKMFDTIDLYVQQCSFAEFESIAYDLGADKLSAEVLNELSLRLSKEYGYFEEGWEEYYAMSWSDIPHFFESPFYVVSYPISNDIALQLYELEKGESGAGVDKLCQMLPRQFEGLMDTALDAGLKSPFEEGRVQQIARDMRDWLSAAD